MKSVLLLFLALSIIAIRHALPVEENVSIVTDGDALRGYSTSEQRALLDAHNKYRRMTPASDMNELLWSPTLAEQAQTWSDGCFFKHPDRKQHSDYEGIGQNLHMSWNSGRNGPPPTSQPVDSWYDEVEDFNYTTNLCNRKAVCGHYTQIVWANTTKVGCGIKFCPLARSNTLSYQNAWLVTCNYSPGGNIVGQKPYKSGKRCTECVEGFCKYNLCSKCKPGERGCVCKRDCGQCGTLNRGNCSCTCQDGYYGPACNERCEDTNPKCGDNWGWPKFLCDDERFSVVKESCPALCGQCTKGPASC